MKAIIPVAGMGTRLRPHTHTIPKALLHVAGKTIIEHILDEVMVVGPTEIIFVVGHLGNLIKEYLEPIIDVPTRYVTQKETLGIAHAIYQGNEYIDESPILIVLGDTIFTADLKGVTERHISAIGVRTVEDPSRFGVVVVDGDHILKVVEKPKEPISLLAIAGVYYITDPPLLINAIKHLFDNDIRTKGEYQLTDALQVMLDRGHEMQTFSIKGWYDCGTPEALLETNRTLLARLDGHKARPGAIIIPPVWIDESAAIQNSIVGPNVSVAAGSIVKDSIISDCIISEYAVVEKIILDASIVGDKSKVIGRPSSVNVGDSSELELK
jgi:glucose-1-phosphate thymidylyltransferase